MNQENQQAITKHGALRQAAQALNEAFALDPEAMTSITAARFPCSPALGNHESIIVRPEEGTKSSLGFISLINGLFGKDGERIAALYDGQNPKCLLGFTVIEEFKILA